jgi:hypothetical protein
MFHGGGHVKIPVTDPRRAKETVEDLRALGLVAEVVQPYAGKASEWSGPHDGLERRGDGPEPKEGTS